MCFDISAAWQTGTTSLHFWEETLSIFLGDVLATIFIAGGASVLWYLLKYPGFRVGANWTYTGWDVAKMGRLPNESDNVNLGLMPNISITSLDLTVKKIIASVWVRERADVHDPGVVHGVRHLQREGLPPEVRTTGGDLLTLPGPTIRCHASKFQQIINCPIFVQTSDGEYYKAQSPGNSPTGIVKLRYEIQNFVYTAKQQLLRKLG
jgi:hypothetical protein